jgi:hypothetical protein
VRRVAEHALKERALTSDVDDAQARGVECQDVNERLNAFVVVNGAVFDKQLVMFAEHASGGFSALKIATHPEE